MDVWYSAAKAIVGTYISLFIQKIHVDGRENIPSGPKIVVANHALATDGFLLPFIFPEKLYYLIQEDTFSLPILGKLLALADQIPVVKGRGQEALARAAEKLAQGGTVALFPEGKLNDGKQLLRAYTGAARLTLESGAPVVPVGFYTPPQFARSIHTHMHGRQTYGSWQFGGPSFISIGNTWQPPQNNLTEASPYQYARIVRGMTDDIMGRVNSLVERARLYAATWFPGIQNQTE
jgi:1-acyl-sn-glycerol-3-phosphate acyltransferase